MGWHHEVQATIGSSRDVVDFGEYVVPRTFRLVMTGTGSDAVHPTTELTFEVRDGVHECRRVVISSVDGGREVQTSDLRKLPHLEHLLEIATATAAMPITDRRDDGGLEATGKFEAGEFQRARTTLRGVRRQAKRKITPEMLEHVAEVYRANPAAPTKAVAEQFDVAHRTGSLYVKQARDAGALGPALVGKGGEK